MIFTKDFDPVLRNLGRELFISDIHYVNDVVSWAKKNKVTLSEPGQPMKLIVEDGRLVMLVRQEISDDLLNGIINGLSVRWTVKDVATDIANRIGGSEKRLVWYFLKEYARTKEDLAGDELLEDQWAITEMENLGFFKR